MRLQLARALMCPADLLLLDEPTNHLDLDALVWLEAWLQRYDGTMIVISHDREFLDAVTNVTLHLDDAKLTRYGGNYSAFEEMRAEQHGAAAGRASRSSRSKIAHLQKFIDRFKAKASKAKQAQSRVKALERMEKLAPVLAERRLQFEFKEPLNLPNPMLSIADASLRLSAPEDAPPARANRHRATRQPLGAGRPAHRHPGRQRPGQVDAGEDRSRGDLRAAGRRDHRRQGPEHRLLRAAGTRRAAPADAR